MLQNQRTERNTGKTAHQTQEYRLWEMGMTPGGIHLGGEN